MLSGFSLLTPGASAPIHNTLFFVSRGQRDAQPRCIFHISYCALIPSSFPCRSILCSGAASLYQHCFFSVRVDVRHGCVWVGAPSPTALFFHAKAGWEKLLPPPSSFVLYGVFLSGRKMSRQTIGKTLLRNVIRHTDAHNKVRDRESILSY